MAKRTQPAQTALKDNADLVPLTRIEQSIFVIRGQRVMLDAALAAFYEVSTKRLNEQVKRNPQRFPADFVFQLTADEAESLRSQNATLDVIGPLAQRDDPQGSLRGKHSKYRPYAFTEHGALMAATVLKSPRAVQVSVLVVRAFVRLRHILAEHRELARRIEALAREFADRTDAHEQHIRRLYDLLDELMNPPPPPRKGRIGFVGG
jgi:hypothetical protein